MKYLKLASILTAGLAAAMLVGVTLGLTWAVMITIQAAAECLGRGRYEAPTHRH